MSTYDISQILSVPTDVEDLPQYLAQAMPALQEALNNLGDVQRALNVEPAKPREGDLRYADGSDWDPGSGAGLYRFTAGSWVRQASAAGIDAYLALAGGTMSGDVAMGSNDITGAGSVGITGSPSGTPAKATLYEDNLIGASITMDPASLTGDNDLTGVDRYFNISGVVDNSAGHHTVYFDRDFAATTYGVTTGLHRTGGQRNIVYDTEAVGSVHIYTSNAADTANGDATKICMNVVGKLAA